MRFKKIRKRDGRIEEFKAEKITNAIAKAGAATGEFDREVAKKLTIKVLSLAEEVIKSDIPTVEEIQDIVEEVLLTSPYKKTAKAYIIYRDQHAKIREIVERADVSLVDQYLQKLDWQVRENSNMTFSLQGLNNYISSQISRIYWLNKIYPPEVKRAHVEGDFHIHDLNLLAVYTYYGKEVVVAKVDGQIKLLSFEQLYEIVDAKEELLNERDAAFAKYPRNVFVLDREGFVRVKRIVKKRKDRRMRFIKNRGGRSVIVTEDHPMITEKGEKIASEVVVNEDKTFTVDIKSLLKDEKLFYKKEIDLLEEIRRRRKRGGWGRNCLCGHQIYFNGVPIEEVGETSEDGILHTRTFTIRRKIALSEEFGYFVGFALAEGCIHMDENRSWCISISQKEREKLLEVNRVLLNLGISGCLECREDEYKRARGYELIIRNPFLRFLFDEVFKIKCGSRHKTLPIDILQYNKDFIKGVIGGLLDGDGTIETSKTVISLRISSRTLLEQLSIVLSLLGWTPRDRKPEGQGSVREFRGRKIVQNYPIYGVSFRKTEEELPSDKYKSAKISAKAWHDERKNEWHKVINNEETEIPDDFIYDVTTESGTLVVNGMWNHNCVGWDLYDLLLRGFGGVPGKIESKPARHFRSALGQVVNYFYTLQGESAGAQAFSNFDTLLSPFIRYDNLSERDVEQALQEFVFNINVPTRVGFQTPFTNITLDVNVPTTFADMSVVIGGEPRSETYADFQDEMDMFNRAFLKVLLEGDAKGRVFSVDGDALCPIKNSGRFELVRIGKFIDNFMEKRSPVFVKERNCEVLDVRDLDLKCIGLKNGKLGWQKINYLIRHPQSEVLKITTDGGFNIRVTPAHSVLVLKDGRIQSYPAGKLKKGDYLVAPKKFPQEKSEVDAISLAHEFIRRKKAKGVYIRGVQKEGKLYKETRRCEGKFRYNYKVEVFPLENISAELDKFDLSKARLSLRGSKVTVSNFLSITKDLVEFLGWYCAEGSAERGKYGGVSLGLNLLKERKRAHYLAEVIRRVFGVPVSLREVKERNLIEIRVHSKLVRRIITEVFEIENGEGKRVPQIIFELDPELKRVFLESYFKGDAWITENIVATSVSRELIYGISTILKQLNVFHTLEEYSWKGKKRYRIRIFNNRDLKAKSSHTISKIPLKESGIEELVCEILRKEPFYMDNLGRRYKNTKKRILRKFGITNQRSTNLENVKKIANYAQNLNIELPPALQEILEDEISFFRIKRIEKVDSTNGMVYDFSTESETFVADQLIVHNTFPIPTYNITKDFRWDDECIELLWEVTAKYGIPYFSNFINSDMRPEDARSMCCRLRLDLKKLERRGGGLFGASPMTGSIGVVTINMP
ncbi:MAG: hypothetical protein J7L30_03585, partial [Methanophagales archaeon]|nr:hypothetical protein [Methanophagales archaeon]